MTQQTKRHHYVPKAYLNAWRNEKGRLLVYRKDHPGRALPLVPDATQFRTYYYSQPMPNGGQDNNTLEQLFSRLEDDWPPLVAALERGEDVNDRLETVFQFISLQRARVPAARDAMESMLAETTRASLQVMLQNGTIEPPPRELGECPRNLDFSIDPHQSIHAMVAVIQAMGTLFSKIGITAAHNKTGREFLTSDNPVLWFDPSLPFDEQRPYTVNPNGGPIFLIFPVSPTLAILGSTDYQATYSEHGLFHSEVSERAFVDLINSQVCRFGYECVIARSTGYEEEAARFAEVSPIHEAVPVTVGTGVLTVHRQLFGKRQRKPKWKSD
jgi:Protein of unknown function (DUF4238)